ncbi:type III secretion system translocon subunit SctB [Chthonobacter rhizosphaerae]|uniref:type III secretion system translocon subunit SctB n=1 Tax=Chthonobacter rhizosphaerae TaxID=2735553 RepID=UPI0015EE8713|nr:type III secretion system translocon subunit SctB [Chthonobacter rhizosphaerae]
MKITSSNPTPLTGVGPTLADEETRTKKSEQPGQTHIPSAESTLSATGAQTLAKSDGSDLKDVDSVLKALEDAMAGRSLEDLWASSTSSDVIRSLLGRLAVEQATSQRQAALNERTLSRQEAKSALLGQAGEMENAAKEMMRGAVLSLALAVTASAISIIGAVASIGGSLKNVAGKMNTDGAAGAGKAAGTADSVGDAAKDLGKPGSEAVSKAAGTMDAVGDAAKETAKASSGWRNLSGLEKALFVTDKIANPAGGVFSAAGNFLKAESDARGKELEAKGMRLSAEAQDLQADADRAKELQQAAEDLLKAIIAFLKELQEAEVNAMQAMTRV